MSAIASDQQPDDGGNDEIRDERVIESSSGVIEPSSGNGTSKAGDQLDRVILDVGSGYMLKGSSVKEWFERFRRYARRSPTEICLPAVGWAGPFFDSSVQPSPAFLGSNDPLRRWVADAREVLGEDGVVWAKVVIDGGFFRTQHLFQTNQFGIAIHQGCIVNPIVQDIFAVLTQEILEHGVDGVVFDLTDAFPNSGSRELQFVSIHCFCSACRDAMRAAGFPLEARDFSGATNPLHMVLRDGKDGTAHIDPTIEMIRTRDYEALVDVATSRGFVEEINDPLGTARKVIDYCEARGSVTADALRTLTRPIKGSGALSAAIIGSVDFDQSQQVTLDQLSRGPAADEFWVPDAPVDIDTQSPLVCYLGSRSTYYMNSFFEVLETANDIIGSAGLERFLERLLSTSKKVSGANELSPASLFSVAQSPQYGGVVGVPLFEHEHRRLVEDLTSDVTGQVLPDSVLEQFRIAAGPSALAP